MSKFEQEGQEAEAESPGEPEEVKMGKSAFEEKLDILEV